MEAAIQRVLADGRQVKVTGTFDVQACKQGDKGWDLFNGGPCRVSGSGRNPKRGLGGEKVDEGSGDLDEATRNADHQGIERGDIEGPKAEGEREGGKDEEAQAGPGLGQGGIVARPRSGEGIGVVLARGPLGPTEDYHGNDEAPDEDGDGMLEDGVLLVELGGEPGPEDQVDVFQEFHDEADDDGDGGNAAGVDLTVGQEPVNQEKREHGNGKGGKFEDKEPQPETDLSMAAGEITNPAGIDGGEHE